MAAYQPPSTGLSTWHPGKLIAVAAAGGAGLTGILIIVGVLLGRYLLGK